MTRILRILCFYQSIHVRIEELWRLWGSYLGSSRLPSIALSSHCRLSHEVAQVRTSKWLIIRRPIYCVKNTTSNIICRVRLSYLILLRVYLLNQSTVHTCSFHVVREIQCRCTSWSLKKIGSWTEFHNLTEKSLGYKCLSGNSELRYVLAVSTNKLNLVLQCSFVCA